MKFTAIPGEEENSAVKNGGKGQRIMKQKEMLKEQIEKERKKLDDCMERGTSMEETYRQSLTLDRLIEQYLGL